MSLLTHIDALATHATRLSAGSSDDLSSILLIASAVAMGAAGIGLVILCARALFARKTATPQPWMATVLSSPTIHTRKFAEAKLETSEAVSTLEAMRQIETESPLSDPDADAGPVTIRLPPTAPDAAPPAPSPPAPSTDDASPLSGRGPSSADPTLEMDTRAFGSSVKSDNDVEPVEVSPPSEPTDTEVFLGSPIPLVARKVSNKGTAGQTLEIFPAPVEETPVPTSDGREPMAVHRSGTVPKADPAFMRTLPSFHDGARRA
jgi:hypothetical protein